MKKFFCFLFLLLLVFQLPQIVLANDTLLTCQDSGVPQEPVFNDTTGEYEIYTPNPVYRKKPDGEFETVGEMLDAVRGGKIKYLTDLTAFDTYRSDAIGKCKKSVALSFTFASLEGTLKDEEINCEIDRILSILKRRFGAKIRG